jgi:hypothetical protein
MKLKVLFLILGFLFLFVPFSFAQEQKVDVNLEISPQEIRDAYVVGDCFYYKINFTNTGIEIINDTFTISVFNPSRSLIDIPRTYNISIEPNSSRWIIAKGDGENETAIFPFDTRGDYKIEIKSTKPIDFYRWFIVEEDKKYIRQNKKFNYFFDAMPRWQYNLWKDTEEANQKIIEANQKLLDLTIDLNKATKSMERATWIMVIVAFFTLCVAIISGYVAYKAYKISKRL